MFLILDHEMKRKQFSLVAPMVALPQWWPTTVQYDGGLTAYDGSVMMWGVWQQYDGSVMVYDALLQQCFSVWRWCDGGMTAVWRRYDGGMTAVVRRRQYDGGSMTAVVRRWRYDGVMTVVWYDGGMTAVWLRRYDGGIQCEKVLKCQKTAKCQNH